MIKSAILHSAVVSQVASSAVPLTMKHTEVEMNFDGQPIKLFVDSASDMSYLVYGGWYESIYGKGACKYLRSGCYFCPSTNLCDLNSLRTQKIQNVTYGKGGQRDEFVHRTMTLKIGQQEVENFQVGLLVGSTRIELGLQPYAVLGLSLSPAQSRPVVRMPPPLEQLVSSRIISTTAFSVHASEFSVGINGELVLGRSRGTPKDMVMFPLRTVSWNKVASGLFATRVRVSSPSGYNEVIDYSNGEGYRSVVIDTGTDSTPVPKEVFSMVLRAIEFEVGQDRVAHSLETVKSKSHEKFDAYVNPKRQIRVRRKILEQLPVMEIQADSGSVFEVNLSQHIHSCAREWCRLLVTDRLRSDPSFDNFILGWPFFAQRDVYVDYEQRTIGFATQAKPATMKIASMEEWHAIRSPPCRRRSGLTSALARLFRRS